ncbi:MAG: hypothetical protein ACOZQL_11540 [Myxococcota bacterium]
MVPDKMDPRWRDLVSGKKAVQFSGLATRILFTRVRLLGSKPDEASVRQAIALAHDYFEKNEKAAADDLRLAFN